MMHPHRPSDLTRKKYGRLRNLLYFLTHLNLQTLIKLAEQPAALRLEQRRAEHKGQRVMVGIRTKKTPETTRRWESLSQQTPANDFND